jgi:hypothetical protein
MFPRPVPRHRRKLGSFCTIGPSHSPACLSGGGKLGSFCTIRPWMPAGHRQIGFVSHDRLRRRPSPGRSGPIGFVCTRPHGPRPPGPFPGDRATNWLRLAHSAPRVGCVPRTVPSARACDPQIGFVCTTGPRRPEAVGRRGHPAGSPFSIRNVVTPGCDRGPQSVIEELGLFCAFDRSKVGSFLRNRMADQLTITSFPATTCRRIGFVSHDRLQPLLDPQIGFVLRNRPGNGPRPRPSRPCRTPPRCPASGNWLCLYNRPPAPTGRLSEIGFVSHLSPSGPGGPNWVCFRSGLPTDY